jgi:hypothetical protein
MEKCYLPRLNSGLPVILWPYAQHAFLSFFALFTFYPSPTMLAPITNMPPETQHPDEHRDNRIVALAMSATVIVSLLLLYAH